MSWYLTSVLNRVLTNAFSLLPMHSMISLLIWSLCECKESQLFTETFLLHLLRKREKQTPNAQVPLLAACKTTRFVWENAHVRKAFCEMLTPWKLLSSRTSWWGLIWDTSRELLRLDSFLGTMSSQASWTILRYRCIGGITQLERPTLRMSHYKALKAKHVRLLSYYI